MIMLQGKNSSGQFSYYEVEEDGEWGMQIQNDIAAEFIYIHTLNLLYFFIF